jgi:hypothetical protein
MSETAASVPASCAAIKAGADDGAMPAKVSERLLRAEGHR